MLFTHFQTRLGGDRKLDCQYGSRQKEGTSAFEFFSSDVVASTDAWKTDSRGFFISS